MGSRLRTKQGLVETSAEELAKVTRPLAPSPQAGVPGGTQVAPPATPPVVPALSPAAAKAAGANPDEAKMAGTKAQKTSALAEQAKPLDQQLDRQQRQVGGVATTTDAQAAEMAAAKADRIRALGSLDERVTALLAAKLKPTAPVPAPTAPVRPVALNEAQLTGLFPDPVARDAAKAALTTYLGGARSEQDLANLANAVGLDAINAGNLASVMDTKGMLGAEAKALAPTEADFQVGKLDLGMDLGQLASDLGVPLDQLQTMSVDQLQQQVASLQANQFSQANALRAERAGADPNRRKQIDRQLRAMGETGQLATEDQVQALSHELESDQQVEFNGTPYKIGDLLHDGTISSQLMAAADNDADMANLAKNHPDLAAWVKSHRAALSDIAAKSTMDVSKLAEANKPLRALAVEVGSGLADALFPGVSKYMTATEVASAIDKIKTSPVYAAVSVDPDSKALFARKPELAAAVKTWTADQIKAGVAAAKDLASGDPALTKLLGGSPGDIVPPDAVAKLAEIKPALAAANDAIDTEGKDLLARAIADGWVDSPAMLKHIADSPEILKDVKRIEDERKVLAKTDDPDTLVKYLFGGTANSLDSVRHLVDEANLVSGDPMLDGDADAKAFLGKAAPYLDVDGDGKLTRKDFENPAAVAAKIKSMANTKSGKELLAGNSAKSALGAGRDYLGQIPASSGKPFGQEPPMASLGELMAQAKRKGLKAVPEAYANRYLDKMAFSASDDDLNALMSQYPADNPINLRIRNTIGTKADKEAAWAMQGLYDMAGVQAEQSRSDGAVAPTIKLKPVQVNPDQLKTALDLLDQRLPMMTQSARTALESVRAQLINQMVATKAAGLSQAVSASVGANAAAIKAARTAEINSKMVGAMSSREQN